MCVFGLGGGVTGLGEIPRFTIFLLLSLVAIVIITNTIVVVVFYCIFKFNTFDL